MLDSDDSMDDTTNDAAFNMIKIKREKEDVKIKIEQLSDDPEYFVKQNMIKLRTETFKQHFYKVAELKQQYSEAFSKYMSMKALIMEMEQNLFCSRKEGRMSRNIKQQIHIAATAYKDDICEFLSDIADDGETKKQIFLSAISRLDAQPNLHESTGPKHRRQKRNSEGTDVPKERRVKPNTKFDDVEAASKGIQEKTEGAADSKSVIAASTILGKKQVRAKKPAKGEARLRAQQLVNSLKSEKHDETQNAVANDVKSSLELEDETESNLDGRSDTKIDIDSATGSANNSRKNSSRKRQCNKTGTVHKRKTAAKNVPKETVKIVLKPRTRQKRNSESRKSLSESPMNSSYNSCADRFFDTDAAALGDLFLRKQEIPDFSLATDLELSDDE